MGTRAWGVRAARLGLCLGLLPLACLRAPIGDDHGDGSFGATVSPDGGDPGGLSASDGIGDPSDGTSVAATTDVTTTDPADACHPSYDPCLPIVDDLDCPDVVALGAAPVAVIGPDDYGLDRDHDGIGCER